MRGIDIDYSLATSKSQIIPEQPEMNKSKAAWTKPSVSELFSERIIKRGPAKMINFTQGYVVLAYSDMFAYFSVQDCIERVGSDRPGILIEPR